MHSRNETPTASHMAPALYFGCTLRSRRCLRWIAVSSRGGLVTRRLFVSHRENHRIQVFDENGKFITMWDLGPYAAAYHLVLTADRHLWISDGYRMFKILEYDLDGKLLYSRGTRGNRCLARCGECTRSRPISRAISRRRSIQRTRAKVRSEEGRYPAKPVGQQMCVGYKD